MKGIIIRNNESNIYNDLNNIGNKIIRAGIRYDEFFFSNTYVNNNINEISIYFAENVYLRNMISTTNIPDFNEAEQNFGSAGNDFLMRYYYIMNKLAFHIITNSYQDKLSHALEILVKGAEWNYGNLSRGYLSFASHINGFFTRWADMEAIKSVFEKKYTLYREQVVKVIMEEGDGILNGLSENLNKLKTDAELAFKRGELIFPQDQGDGNPDLFYRSKFHLSIKNNREFSKYMNSNFNFLASRLFTIFFYLYNKKIGIKNIDRYLLAYLIYRGVEDVYRLDAIEIINNFKGE